MTSLILLKDFLETQIELWRPIEGFSGYEVSSIGRVRSFWRKSGSGSSVKNDRKYGAWTYVLGASAHLLSHGSDKDGYHYVRLRGRDSKTHHCRIHRLVSSAFIANPRPTTATKVNHRNNVTSDNRLENLEWCTQQENEDHARAIGVWPKGESHGMARVTESDVRIIRQRSGNGESNLRIAKDYGITGAAVYRIKKRLTWKEVI